MKTDTIFYHLFQAYPAVFFELIGQAGETAVAYEFTSVELKELAFRLDGLFVPRPGIAERPLYFVEVQFQKDPALYARLFTEIFVYLYQYTPPQDWRAVVVYPQRSLDVGRPEHYREFFDSGRITRVYLNELVDNQPASLGLGVVQLVAAPESEADVRARRLLTQARQATLAEIDRQEIVGLIETVMIYKFPHKSREEIETMLGLSDLKETRVYREAWQEGVLEGRQEGRQEGMREGLLAGIELGLEIKFGAEGLLLLPEVYKIEDTAVLRALHQGLKANLTLAQWRRIYTENGRLAANGDS
jgi:predicted transposase/invertase (TIGR01784 family)